MSEATITALLEALKKSPQAPTTLIPPSFNWSSKDQYDNFQLFVRSVDSWFTLQRIPEKAGELENPVHLNYILNFLSNQGRQRYNHWQPTGADAEAQKKSASAFLDHLQSMMDHDISIGCRIYKLEETHILPSETPNELVDCLQTLADCCNFPTDDKKEWNMQYWLICALDNRELVKKLVALPIKETTAKMLEVCRTYNTINSEMEALGLGSSKTIHAIHKGPQQKGQQKGHKPQQQQQRQQHSRGNCTKQHAPG